MGITQACSIVSADQFHLQSCPACEFRLPLIAGQKFFRAQQQSRGDVKRVKGAGSDRFRVQFGKRCSRKLLSA